MRPWNALTATASAVHSAGAADASTPRDEDLPVPAPAFPADARAVIHCPAPSVMSSGRWRVGEWVLEFERRSPLFIEPLMGWTGSADTLSQVRLRFPSREAAIAYAHRQGLRYEVREPAHLWSGGLAAVA
jgi:hypothetical protein